MDFYWFSRKLVRIYLKIAHKLRVIGHVPDDGALILCANHSSFWDPPIVGVSVSRRAAFLAKESLFENPLFGKLISSLGAFPLKRGGDAHAVRTAVSILQSGRVLTLFPEGTRVRGKRIAPKSGFIRIALMTGARVVPIGINHEKHAFAPITVRIGEPVDFSGLNGASGEELQKAAADFMDVCYKLCD